MSETNSLLKEIRVFCRRLGMKPSTFGVRAVNDGKLYQRLSDGSDVRTATAAKIRKFMKTHPQNAARL